MRWNGSGRRWEDIRDNFAGDLKDNADLCNPVTWTAISIWSQGIIGTENSPLFPCMPALCSPQTTTVSNREGTLHLWVSTCLGRMITPSQMSEMSESLLVVNLIRWNTRTVQNGSNVSAE